MYADDTNLARAPGYATLASTLQYRVERNFAQCSCRVEFDTFVRLENALDQRVIGSVIVNDANLRYYEPAPGRRAMLGVAAVIRF